MFSGVTMILVFSVSFSGERPAHNTGELTAADIPRGLSADLKALIKKTFSADPSRRMQAANELGKLRERAAPAIPFLIRLLGDDASPSIHDGDVNAAASLALADIGVIAVEPMIAALRESSGEKRCALIFALSQFDDRRIVSLFADLLADMDSRVRSMAAKELDDYFRKTHALSEDANVIQSLIRAMEDKDSNIRGCAVTSLGYCHAPQVVEPMLKMLKDTNTSVRWCAIQALGHTGDSRAKSALLEIMQNRRGKEREREIAADALGYIGDPAIVDVLIAVLKDRSSPTRLRYGAASGLGHAGNQRGSGAVACSHQRQI